MDDKKIIEMYFARNEKAVDETRTKYGSFINHIAFNILRIPEDAEECENDTYLRLWNAIPPDRPEYFKAYIGKIVRNISISLYRKNTAAKRGSGVDVLLSELEDCIPSSESVEAEIDAKYLSSVISEWLRTLSEENRVIFIKRYWYGESVKDIAAQSDFSPAELSSLLFALRKKLKKELTEKGVTV